MNKKLTPSAEASDLSVSEQPVLEQSGKDKQLSESFDLSEPQTEPPNDFAIVGIGASAGGMAAFEAFFSGIPPDIEPEMAFVIVQHLAPEHKSLLADLLQRHTHLPVVEAEDGMTVKINCVYIIPPNRDMALFNGTLQLLTNTMPRGQRTSVDFFFSSLAQDQHERAIGILLSGAGSDGTLGGRAIKAEGGMVMVQKAESAQFDGMVRSAIASGMADYQLLPRDMPAQLVAYVTHLFGQKSMLGDKKLLKPTSGIQKIFILLRAQTGHDFSMYKLSTIYRRIQRRMAVCQIVSSAEYVHLLQHNPAEVNELFCDLLIGVTHFFRDTEAFQVLETQIIPGLFEDKQGGGAIRVWITGCSTGEEAYSIAILLQERMDYLKQSFQVQIFATDIDSRAIAIARSGVYPASAANHLTPERLARFFTEEPDGQYRIHKTIRDMLIFSEHSLIKDPPFSRLDLICCRNLLIYFTAELQKKIIPLFYYGLNPGAKLFLGSSEGISDYIDLFAVLDRKAKLYQRKTEVLGLQRLNMIRTLPADIAPPRIANKPLVKLPLKELTEQALLQHLEITAVLVNAHGDILYLHGRSGMYFELAPGEIGVNNVLKMAREGLRRELTVALHQAVLHKEIVSCPKLYVRSEAHYRWFKLTVRPLRQVSDVMLYLLVFEEIPGQNQAENVLIVQNQQKIKVLEDVADFEHASDVKIAALMQELRAKDEFLQAANEELESSNEELKSSGEEMQSVNEELHSTNEELETSKEELQSVNEELATVNAELHTKVSDLSRANNDMSNLLAGTGVGTIFIDHQLKVLSFTPPVTDIINLIPGDVGRPVAHIASNLLVYDRLVADVQAVLKTLIPKEIEMQTVSGHWYVMRIQPYRTLENVIEGAVISFVDITAMKRAQEALILMNEQFQSVVRELPYCIYQIDRKGRLKFANRSFLALYGVTMDEIAGKVARDYFTDEWSKKHMLEDDAVMQKNQRFSALYETKDVRNGALKTLEIIKTPMHAADASVIGMQGLFWDVAQFPNLGALSLAALNSKT